MDGEMLYALLFPVIAGWVLAWLALGLPLPHCAIHDLTGLPCLTCGSTRAIGSLLRGDWVQAIRWNPGVIAVSLMLALAWIYSAIVCLFRLRRFRPPLSRQFRKGLSVALVTLVTVNWIYLLLTLP